MNGDSGIEHIRSDIIFKLTGYLVSHMILSMSKYQIVIDTNVFIAALRSSRGASYKLLTLIDSGKFEANISIPLILEYEEVAKRLVGPIALSENDIDNILDYICKVAGRWKVFYLWRPFLKDPKDDMILELAITAECNFIVTYNKSDFKGVEQFGIRAVTAKEFLQEIGELP
jgi:putative PIN family toxin of toxin-antitoxin system